MELEMKPCSSDYKVVNLRARHGDYSALKNVFDTLFKRFHLDICKYVLDYFSSIDENRKILKRIEHLLLYVDFRYTLISGGPVVVDWVNISYTQDPIAEDKFLGFVNISSSPEL